jgi:hypothetical protein
VGLDSFCSLNLDSGSPERSGEPVFRRGSAGPGKVTTRGGSPSLRWRRVRHSGASPSISVFGPGNATSWGFQFSLKRRVFHLQAFRRTTRCSTPGPWLPPSPSSARFLLVPAAGLCSGWPLRLYCGDPPGTIFRGSNRRHVRIRRGGIGGLPEPAMTTCSPASWRALGPPPDILLSRYYPGGKPVAKTNFEHARGTLMPDQ